MNARFYLHGPKATQDTCLINYSPVWKTLTRSPGSPHNEIHGPYLCYNIQVMAARSFGRGTGMRFLSFSRGNSVGFSRNNRKILIYSASRLCLVAGYEIFLWFVGEPHCTLLLPLFLRRVSLLHYFLEESQEQQDRNITNLLR